MMQKFVLIATSFVFAFMIASNFVEGLKSLAEVAPLLVNKEITCFSYLKPPKNSIDDGLVRVAGTLKITWTNPDCSDYGAVMCINYTTNVAGVKGTGSLNVYQRNGVWNVGNSVRMMDAD